LARSVKIGRGVRQGCCLSPILLNLYSKGLTKEALEGFGDFKTGGQIIHTVKYADDIVLLAKEGKVLQDMIDKIIETERCYGMEMNVEKTNLMGISRQPFPGQIMIEQKHLENMKSFKYLGSMLTDDGRYMCEIKSRISMAKAAFKRERALFISTLNLKKIEEETIKMLHFEHNFIWCWILDALGIRSETPGKS
jgi:hypothetical protein